jgi:hypothetical protein
VGKAALKKQQRMNKPTNTTFIVLSFLELAISIPLFLLRLRVINCIINCFDLRFKGAAQRGPRQVFVGFLGTTPRYILKGNVLGQFKVKPTMTYAL